MAETVSVRLPEELVEALEEIARATGRSRSGVLRDVVQRGVAEARMERGLEGYRRGEASLERASRIADVPITVFLGELRNAGIPFQYGVGDVERDLAWADER